YKIRNLAGYRHKIFYYGPEEASRVKDVLAAEHRVVTPLRDYPPRREYKLQHHDETTVYFVDYDQVQAELMMLVPNGTFNASDMAPANVFNQYFGAGLSSIVFQEIRESKALAYSAYSVYTSPSRADEHHFVQAYIGAQSDKLGEAVSAMQSLMSQMPREESNFEQARLGALKQMESNPTTKSAIFWSYQQNLDRGLVENPRPAIYADIQSMTMNDMQAFFDRNIKDRPFVYIVIGKKSEMDMAVFSEMGTVREMKLKDIFGY
ncbi:MAG: M16 family metallopeptidase, partial [Owenweeksia sp.]